MMTMEISEKGNLNLRQLAALYHQDLEKVAYYEEHGLLNLTDVGKNEEDYHVRLGDRFCLLQLLLASGLPLEKLPYYVELLEQGNGTCLERIKILQRLRSGLLRNLHLQQKALDDLDFMIYRLKKGGTE